jgi:hypothetical protein
MLLKKRIFSKAFFGNYCWKLNNELVVVTVVTVVVVAPAIVVVVVAPATVVVVDVEVVGQTAAQQFVIVVSQVSPATGHSPPIQAKTITKRQSYTETQFSLTSTSIGSSGARALSETSCDASAKYD